MNITKIEIDFFEEKDLKIKDLDDLKKVLFEELSKQIDGFIFVKLNRMNLQFSNFTFFVH